MRGFERFRGYRRDLRKLEGIFRRSAEALAEGPPIRVTRRGLWVPTPFEVLLRAFDVAAEMGLFRSCSGGKLAVDAGAGDGRVVILLSHREPSLRVAGVESDAILFHQAEANLEEAQRRSLLARPERVRLAHGDYCAVATYESIRVELRDVGLVFNYPDGNQRALERFLIDNGASGTRLCLLTHDTDVVLRELSLETKTRIRAAESSEDWYLSVYAVGADA